MIGGFLGAGKTTAIARLAKHYTEQGLRVGIVTNDQAFGLVDTALLKAQGFHVGEVPGACFCCKFDDLVETAISLGADEQPDIIIAEPVGSCTDLVATVVHPLRHLYGDRYEIGPLAVLCKPEHGRKILGGGTGGFTPQAAYIFLKQLEEAQLVVINKADKLSNDEQQQLLDLVREKFPHKQVLAASALSGVGFDDVIEFLTHESLAEHDALEIDYNTYAEGEAALGWFNATVRVGTDATNQPSWPLDQLVLKLVGALDELFTQAEMEPGHVKVLASSGANTAVANWVASGSQVDLSVSSDAMVSAADLLINARVHTAPDEIASIVETAVERVSQQMQLETEVVSIQHFRPGRPVPVHRYSGQEG